MNDNRSPVGNFSVAASARGAALVAGKGLDEHRIDQGGRRLAAGTMRKRHHLVGQAGPPSPECLDTVEDHCFAISHGGHR